MKAINEQDYKSEVLEYEGAVVIDFWAPRCGPCRMLTPVLEELDKKYNEKVKFLKVDVDQNEGLARQYSIQGVPTVMIFNNGELVGDPLVGIKPPAVYEEILDGIVS